MPAADCPRKKADLEKFPTNDPVTISDEAFCGDLLRLGGGAGAGLLEGLERIPFSKYIKHYRWKIPILPLVQAWAFKIKTIQNKNKLMFI